MTTERISLCQPIESRDGTLNADSYTSNGFFETQGNRKEFVKRPGLVALTQITPVTPPAYLNSQGLFDLNGKLYAVINNVLYKIDPSSSYAVTNLGSLSATNKDCYFAKTFLDTYLFFHNTVNCYLIDQSGSFVSMSTPPNGPYVPGVVFLDNYIFIGTTSNRIYNCSVGDPTTWNALGYISFQQTTDDLVGITKYLNYLVAFGTASTQFFYDAALTPPASPLQLAPSYSIEIGCANGDSIVSSTNTVFWVGVSKTYGKSIYLMNGVAPTRISTHAIDKFLETDGVSTVTAYCYSISGHVLYILNLNTSGITLVFDMVEQEWYTWSQYSMQSNDQPNPGTYQESYFRPTYYAETNNIPYLLDDDTATLYSLSTTTYQDAGQPIYYRSVTKILDSGTTKRKFYGRAEVVGDKVSGGSMTISHSGNDYQTYSTGRTVDLNSSRPQVYLSGADRRRSWQFLSTSNVPLRLESVEIDFRLGEMDQEQSVGGGQNYGA